MRIDGDHARRVLLKVLAGVVVIGGLGALVGYLVGDAPASPTLILLVGAAVVAVGVVILVSHLVPIGNVRVRFFNSQPAAVVQVRGTFQGINNIVLDTLPQNLRQNEYYVYVHPVFGNVDIDQYLVFVNGVQLPPILPLMPGDFLGEIFVALNPRGQTDISVTYGRAPSPYPTDSFSV